MDFIRNKCIFFLVTFVLFSLKIHSIDDLLKGQYLIKNVKHNEYIYVSDADRIGGDRVVKGSPGIFSGSIFKFEKNIEGYLIKNVKHNEYIYIADIDRIGNQRAVITSPRIMAKSYFDIIFEDNKYILKNKKHSEYAYVADEDRVSGQRAVKTEGSIMPKSYFSFKLYDDNDPTFHIKSPICPPDNTIALAQCNENLANQTKCCETCPNPSPSPIVEPFPQEIPSVDLSRYKLFGNSFLSGAFYTLIPELIRDCLESKGHPKAAEMTAAIIQGGMMLSNKTAAASIATGLATRKICDQLGFSHQTSAIAGSVATVVGGVSQSLVFSQETLVDCITDCTIAFAGSYAGSYVVLQAKSWVYGFWQSNEVSKEELIAAMAEQEKTIKKQETEIERLKKLPILN